MLPSRLRTGKLAATSDAKDLRLADYATILTPPKEFGIETPFPAKGWGMLGNDEWGCCAEAGPGHETMAITAAGGKPATFTTAGILDAYSAITGFRESAGPPGDNPTDQGSNVRDVLKYRQKTGILDATGRRHKIGPYMAVENSLAHIYTALYLFGIVGLGLRFPNSAMTQFQEGKAWSVVPGEAEPTEGHYVCLVAKRRHLEVVSWGQIVLMLLSFLTTYADEIWTYTDAEFLKNGKSPAGFNLAQLEADLKLV